MVVFCERRKKVEDDRRGEQVGDVESLNRVDHFCRVRFAGDGEGDVRDDRGDAEQEVDQRVEGEGGQVNFVWGDIEGALEQIQLCR